MLKFFQACLHPLECGFAVGVLRSALGSSDGYTGRAMHQAHACFDFIAMLPAWPTSDNELEIAIAFKRFPVGWIHERQKTLPFEKDDRNARRSLFILSHLRT